MEDSELVTFLRWMLCPWLRICRWVVDSVEGIVEVSLLRQEEIF